jgi:hypothetical protein
MAQTQLRADVDGDKRISKVLVDLLNTFPGLPSGKTIAFSTLEETSGMGVFPLSGAAILTHKESITGHVRQTCLYAFAIIYRAAPANEDQRLYIKEWLDSLGKWLERAPVELSDETYQLEAYPATNDSRVIKSIARTQQANCDRVYEDGVEDWVLRCSLNYTNEYDT